MLLNSFAQPIILHPDKQYINYEELKESPLLLCHKNALDGKLLPSGWRGSIYGTREMLNEVKQKKYKLNYNSLALYPNETFNIHISNDESQCKVTNIELTAIPWNKEFLIYLIKVDNITSLVTDMFTEDMDIFVQNKILRKAVKNQIDILYINNAVYCKTKDLGNYPSEVLLGALVTLVRPNYVQGLYGDNNIPKHIVNCCKE